MKPDLVSVVTVHMVYFCAFTHSDIFPKNARKLGVGRGQFDAGVNGLTHIYLINKNGSLHKLSGSLYFFFFLLMTGCSLVTCFFSILGLSTCKSQETVVQCIWSALLPFGTGVHKHTHHAEMYMPVSHTA